MFLTSVLVSLRHKSGKRQLCENMTVAYYFCGEPIPYRTSVKGRVVTLGQFKELLTKKGHYKLVRIVSANLCMFLCENCNLTVRPMFCLQILLQKSERWVRLRCRFWGNSERWWHLAHLWGENRWKGGEDWSKPGNMKSKQRFLKEAIGWEWIARRLTARNRMSGS